MVGSRFNLDLLTMLGVEPVVGDLVVAQLIDQVKFTQQPEYVFHHPLIRAVAYEAQLKSDRVQLHRRLATAIQERDPESADENAALIAEHLEAAGDLHGAYSWHMRAGAWSTNRDITAARISWQRARQVADRLPADDPDGASMGIAPRTLVCGSTWRVGGSVADTGFDELRELTTAAGDHVSLAIAMAGLLMTQTLHHQYRESSRLASEQAELLESIGDPTMTVGLLYGANFAKLEAGEAVEAMQLAQRVIDLAAGDPCKGNLLVGSPLALALAICGLARCSLGHPGWSDDVHQAVRTARAVDSTSEVMVTAYSYSFAITNGAILPDATAMRDTAAALQTAEQSGDDVTLVLAQIARGIILIHRKDPEQGIGSDMLAEVREPALRQRNLIAVRLIDIHIAEQKAQTGEIDGAIEMSGASWTTCSTLGKRSGVGRPLLFWWNRCCAGAPTPICRRRMPQSTDWRPCRPTTGSCCTRSGFSGFGRCWPEPVGTRPPTASIGIATAQWRHRLASKDISRGPRRCYEGDRKEGSPFRKRPDMRVSKLRGR